MMEKTEKALEIEKEYIKLGQLSYWNWTKFFQNNAACRSGSFSVRQVFLLKPTKPRQTFEQRPDVGKKTKQNS